MLVEAFGAVAALKQEGLAGGDIRKLALEIAGLAGEDEGRKPGQLTFNVGQRRLVAIDRRLLDRQGSPTARRPAFHSPNSTKNQSLTTRPRAAAALAGEALIEEFSNHCDPFGSGGRIGEGAVARL